MLRFAAVLFLGCAAPLLAQTATTPDGAPPASPGAQHRDHMGGGPGMRGEMRNLPATIANAPVTAQYISTGQMQGRDGVQHTMSSTRVVYRDTLGRVREDVTSTPSGTDASAGNPISGDRAHMHGHRNMTVILDPVAGTVTRLDTDRKVAIVETMPAQFFQREQKREERESNGQPGGKNAQVTDLGLKTIAGVVAKGEKVTRTLPAQDTAETSQTTTSQTTTAQTTTAQTMTREIWFSPDLKLEVSSTETGAHGTRTETAMSISKAEPDAALFKVPDGYTVSQSAPHTGMRHGPRAPRGANGEPDAPPPAM